MTTLGNQANSQVYKGDFVLTVILSNYPGVISIYEGTSEILSMKVTTDEREKF